MNVELLPTAQEFCKQVQYYNGSDKNPIVHFVDFAMDVASCSKTCARAILDADIKSLLSTMGRPPADQLMRFHELGSWEEVGRNCLALSISMLIGTQIGQTPTSSIQSQSRDRLEGWADIKRVWSLGRSEQLLISVSARCDSLICGIIALV
jgi:hypothetical protein